MEINIKMGTSETENGIKGRAEEPVLFTLIALYSILLTICFYQFLKSIGQPRSQSIVRQRLFFVVIMFVCCCNLNIVRIAWGLFYIYTSSDAKLTLVFDAIPNILMGILGSTFSLLWLEMYLSSSILIDDKSKIKCFSFATALYIALNISSAVFHILIIYYANGNWKLVQSSWENNLILDCAESFIVSVSLVITGFLLSKNVEIIFYGNAGKCISNRIWYVAVISCFMFLGKMVVSILSLVYIKTEYKNFIVE